MIDRWQLAAPPPHGGQPVLVAGEPLASARAALVLLHGRGATAEGILDLATRLAPAPEAKRSGAPVPEAKRSGAPVPEAKRSGAPVPEAKRSGAPVPEAKRSGAPAAGGAWPVVAVAPQAAGQTWYPYPFMSPFDQNEPALSSALEALAGLITRLDAAGIPPSQTLVVGFSQGACLALEYVARNARHFGGVAGLSGGLIGPPDTPRDYLGSLDSTPVFLGCGEHDPHIPTDRVIETADVLRRLGGLVTLRLYPVLGHTINDKELEVVRTMLTSLIGP